MTEYKKYIDKNNHQFISELTDWLKIPSVSTDTKFKPRVKEAAEWCQQALLKAGADTVNIYETEGSPIVYGEKIVDSEKPTVLVYGHYDVQPADPYELWDSPPFDPVIIDGKIIGRGSSDDKGQVYIHIKALETMVACRKLNSNIKFLIEGEEEVGSHNLEAFIKEHKKMITADILLISDTSIISNESPSITAGLRGLSYMEVELIGPNRDLHSGTYGGAVANPINVLCDLISSLKDRYGKITIPGFYDDVVELSTDEREALNRGACDKEDFKKSFDIRELSGESTYTTLERIGIRPSLDVNGIWGGYTEKGVKTVLPSKASAKISMRLVPNQNSNKISKLFENHFKKITPKTVKLRVKKHHGGEPSVSPTSSGFYRAAEKAFETVWGKKPIPTREGGSIPVVALFQQELNLEAILMGFGLDEDAIHSPNESFNLSNFVKGIETVSFFHEYLHEML